MTKKIGICYASSDEYAPYSGISLLSLLKNNSQFVDNVYILSFGIKNENKTKLKDIVKNYSCNFVFIDAISILEPIFISLNLDSYGGSYATYARAFISDLIPNNNGRVLYVDSDTIVDGSIEELVNIDMDSPTKLYGAVIGTNQYTEGNNEINLTNGNSIYFACGVMLFNMKGWREFNCSNLICEYINSHGSNYRYADQTVINNTIQEKYVIALHPKYNYWGHIYRGSRFWYQMRLGNFWFRKTIEEAKKNPVIIHYKGYIVHPWRKNNISLLSSRYQYYKSISPWKNMPEYSIYYDFSQGKITKSNQIKYNQQIRNLRYPPYILSLLSILLKIKYVIICRK